MRSCCCASNPANGVPASGGGITEQFGNKQEKN